MTLVTKPHHCTNQGGEGRRGHRQRPRMSWRALLCNHLCISQEICSVKKYARLLLCCNNKKRNTLKISWIL